MSAWATTLLRFPECSFAVYIEDATFQPMSWPSDTYIPPLPCPSPPPPQPTPTVAQPIAKAVLQLLIILIPPPPEMPSLQTCTTVSRSIFLHYNNTRLAAGFSDSHLQSQHCRRQRKGDQNILPVLATWRIQDQSWLHTSRPS